jgi:acetyl esterase/lipase
MHMHIHRRRHAHAAWAIACATVVAGPGLALASEPAFEPSASSAAGAVAARAPGPAPIDAPRLPGATAFGYASPGGPTLPVYVMQPAETAPGVRPRAAIVLFFGGGWSGGSVRQFELLGRELARLGMVVVLPDYRVHDRQGTTAFEAMADARAALRWVRVNADALGVDPRRVAAGGGSAGALLALDAAVFPTGTGLATEAAVPSARPDALVLFNPVLDTASPAWRARFAGRGSEASPLAHPVRGLPPMLILHGRADTIAPYADVEAFCRRVQAQGDRCGLVGYDGAVHGFFNPVNGGGPGFRQTADEAERFLGELGYLPR